MRWTLLGLGLGLGLVALPTDAYALEVMCSNDIGAVCTVNNDPEATVDCTCDGAPAGGTTGGSENPWADYTEEQLLEVCNDNLPLECITGDSTSGGGGGETGDPGTGPVSETTPDSDSSPLTTDSATDPSGPGESDTGENGDTGDDDKDDKGCNLAGGSSFAALLLLPVLWRRRRR